MFRVVKKKRLSWLEKIFEILGIWKMELSQFLAKKKCVGSGKIASDQVIPLLSGQLFQGL